jgi:aldehyde:ferredoxin oxidoreductase
MEAGPSVPHVGCTLACNVACEHATYKERGTDGPASKKTYRFHSVFSFGTGSGSSSSLPASETTS